MKRIVVVLFCLIALLGCTKKDKVTKIKEKPFEIVKIDDSKELVYLTKYDQVVINNAEKDINILTINLKSEDVDNINLEIKNFVINSINTSKSMGKNLFTGNAIDYSYYINDNYISVIQKYDFMLDSKKEKENENVYNVSLKTGKKLENKDLLKEFDMSEEKIYSMIDDKDKDYWITYIKENGYKLFVGDNNKLHCIIEIETDNETIKKELVLN